MMHWVHPWPQFEARRFEAVAIGSSTGGPGLLSSIITSLPADLPFPILVAQHLPPSFTLQLAQQMDTQGALTVVHAEDGMAVLPGVVYVAPGRQHMRVHPSADHKVHIEVSDGPAGLYFKPSVDELLSSVAQTWGRKSLGIVMTGLGQDGCKGAHAIHKAGGVIVTQSQRTCTIYGMPRACDEAGLSSAKLDPPEIRDMLMQFSPQHRHQVVGTH